MKMWLLRGRELRSIERQLCGDGALDALFALFGRLVAGEALPDHEHLDRLWQLHRVRSRARPNRFIKTR